MRLEWVSLAGEDLTDIGELARRCLSADGGLGQAASAEYLESRFGGDGVVAVGVRDAEGRLLACGSVRPTADASMMVGLVDPARRGLGLGSQLLDRLLGIAEGGPDPVRLETESLTDGAHLLFSAKGFRQTFAEDVYRRDLTSPLPAATPPQGVDFAEWRDDNRDAFYEAYRRAFADRPGFPGWTREQWIDWSVDETFLPQCSLVATAADGTPVGFVTCAEDFLIQVGVVPRWRRLSLGRVLAAAALERMRVSGGAEVFLDINVDNPASARLFQGLGFSVIARRARYQLAP